MTPADTLLDLLTRERLALRHADFDTLEALAAEKEQLAARLARAPRPDAALHARLRAAAERNATLLQGLQRGLGNAATQLAALRNGARLNTYDKTGQRATLNGPAGAPIRRA